MSGRFYRPAAGALIFLLLLIITGCDKTPKAVGSQTSNGYGSDGLSIYLTGPARLEGDIKQPEGMQFPIKLKINGPPDGAARITTVHPPLVDGCDIIKSLPMYVELDSAGSAEAEGTVLFASDYACTFGFVVAAAAEFEPDERHYELYDPVDEAEVSMTFTRVVEPGSPQAIRFTARQECEGFVRAELEDDGHVESFQWSPASVKNIEGGRYQAEGSFSVNNVSFNHRCTMDYAKGSGWKLVELEVPGLKQYRSERESHGF
ncbi:MAG: hypothetical protein H3C68_07045 [Deltaproteobacteria bacterium]|nr:hypothetical protein [Deltaproteobacteria bacterium]MBZ0219488.1 hypothetical protein [Deltaproteobacteria bacterium]